MPICPAVGCGLPILENQPTIKLSPGAMLRGNKTGTLYHSATFETDIIVHYGCLFLFFHPQADAEMYDQFYEMVRGQIRNEELEDIKQEAYAEAAQDLTRLCPECLSDKNDPDKPPEEYECSDCRSAALPICPDCGTITDLVITEEEAEAEPNQAYG